MKVTATRRIQFCAGHRLLNHEGKCRNLHGHNYVALLTAEADHLDELGRVIDFSVLKEKIGGWVDVQWDHGFLFHYQDERARAAVHLFPDQKYFVLMCNPTAENMADYLLREVGPQVLGGTGVRLTSVVVWETENCAATARL